MSEYASTIETYELTACANRIPILPPCRCTNTCILTFLEPEERFIWDSLLVRKTFEKNDTILYSTFLSAELRLMKHYYYDRAF